MSNYVNFIVYKLHLNKVDPEESAQKKGKCTSKAHRPNKELP
jgi:hypothetical protein